MTHALLSLALALTQQSPPPSTAVAPSPFEIVRTWTGKELEHLGIGIAALGDIDGKPEFLLSDYESQAGARCGGAVHLVRLRGLGK